MLFALTGCRPLDEAVRPEGQSIPAVRLTANPDDVKVVTSDIDNFWGAYNEATPSNDSIVFRDAYLEKGSPGLKEFARLKIANPSYFAMRVWNRSRYYASIRSSTMAIRAMENQIRGNLLKLKDLYPDALFPDVYFMIGPMNAGGIATEEGLVIGAELFSEVPSSPLDELDPWEVSAIKPVDKIPSVVVHELVHFQQRYQSSAETLLGWSIGEGSADFLAELVGGSRINELQHAYGDRHEVELWEEFKQAMGGNDLSNWLYNGGSPALSGNTTGRPANLGNYFGYRICQAYYERASDKKQAIKEMLEVRDFSRFLAASGYETLVTASHQRTVEMGSTPSSLGQH